MNGLSFSLLVLSAATITLAPAARADGTVAQSCAFLKQSAETRADQAAQGINDNLLSWGLKRRFTNAIPDFGEISPNRLPEAVEAFRKLIPISTCDKARLLQALDDSAKREKIKRHGYHASIKGLGWEEPRYKICGASAEIEPLGRLTTCGVIDLVSGRTTFMIEGERSWDIGPPLVELGQVKPVEAFNNPVIQAMLRAQLRVREISRLPVECRQVQAGSEFVEDARAELKNLGRRHNLIGGAAHSTTGQTPAL